MVGDPDGNLLVAAGHLSRLDAIEARRVHVQWRAPADRAGRPGGEPDHAVRIVEARRALP
ncbi:hypothetical protein [Sorangium sp. So ce1099]|uniref:hypothetical protein n=1 Tax=Sorangium sp. So ce1099 TaxID=3133331 RepID=UPI003F61BE7F